MRHTTTRCLRREDTDMTDITYRGIIHDGLRAGNNIYLREMCKTPGISIPRIATHCIVIARAKALETGALV